MKCCVLAHSCHAGPARPEPLPGVPTPRRGFTLIELLVVVSVIAILAGILVPTITIAREQGKASFCLNNLKQIGLATSMYTDYHRGYYPRVHGGTYASPEPPTQEWWEYLLPLGLKREHMLCKSDPLADTPNINSEVIESYIFNGMFAFGKKQLLVEGRTDKILVSERADAGGHVLDRAVY